MANCGDYCERCGDEIESCDCETGGIGREPLIELLVNDTVGTIKQLAIEDKDDDLSVLVCENFGFDKLTDDELYEQANGLGLL